MPLAVESYEFHWLLMPGTVPDALVGGVGNVCALSMPGLPEFCVFIEFGEWLAIVLFRG